MSTETAPLTWEIVHSWDGPTLKANMANPSMRLEIDRVVAERAEKVKADLQERNATISDREAARMEAQRQREAESMRVQAEARIEADRRLRMTPEERQVEDESKAAAQRDVEEAERKAEIQKKKDLDYLSGGDIDPRLRKVEVDKILAQRRQELSDRDAVILAQQEAEAAAAAGPTQEEKDVAEKATAEKAAADKVAADAAEAEKKALEEAARIAAEVAAAPKKKIIEDFQVEDADGNPIGRRTHLEADTEEEMREKIKKSYAEAVRYAERQKKKKAAMVAYTPVPLLSTLTAEERAALETDINGTDEAKKTLAGMKLHSDELKAQTNESRKQAEYARQNNESLLFMKNHVSDFKQCKANADILADYFTQHNLHWSAENLEIAFEDETLRPRLVAPEQRFVEVDPAIAIAEEKAKLDSEFQARVDAAVKAAVEIEAKKKIEQDAAAANTAAASASVAAVASATASTPAEKTSTPNTSAVTPRKLPAAGIEPGSLHGGRVTTSTTTVAPGVKTPSQIKQEIARMMDTPEGRIKFRKSLKDPKFRELLNSAGIKA
jgi:hypothetical protein